jgi:hypothetical protein
MKKHGKALMSILTVMIFFLTIPEIVIRVLTPEQFARLSDFTSLGGLQSYSLGADLSWIDVCIARCAYYFLNNKNLPAFIHIQPLIKTS